MLLFCGYLIQGFSELFILHYLMRNFLDSPPPPRRQLILSSLIYLAVTISEMYITYDLILIPIGSVTMKLFIAVFYIGKLYQKAFLCALAWLGGICAEGLDLLTIQLALGVQFATDAEMQMQFMPYGCAISAVYRTVFALLIVRLSHVYQRRKRHIFHANLFLIIAFFYMTFMMLVNFGQTRYMPFSLLAIVMMLGSIAICLDMFREQLSAQRDMLKSAFLAEQLSAQLAHYEALYRQMRRTHELRHDMKNILLSTDAYLAQGDTESARAFLGRFQAELSPAALADTGNPLLDAVLTAKQSLRPAPPFTVQIPPLLLKHLDPADLAMLLATALDNAVEGCTPDGTVSVEVRQREGFVTLAVRNPTANHPAGEFPRSTRPDPTEHGYGLRSMYRLAQKWNGHASWSCEDGVFTLRAVLQDLPPLA